jgi:hypothetical protein
MTTKKLFWTLAGIYAAGVVVDLLLYSKTNNVPWSTVARTRHPWVWPYYFATGLSTHLAQGNNLNPVVANAFPSAASPAPSAPDNTEAPPNGMADPNWP